MELAKLAITPSNPLANICFLFYDFMTCQLRGLTFKGRDSSIRNHNNDSSKLGVKPVF
jgi:hypothetical protein